MSYAPITSKDQMYRLLSAGLLGNVCRQFFSLREWEGSDERGRYHSWGVRSLVPGGPCALYVKTGEVRPLLAGPEFAGAGINISPMVDAVARVRLWADVFDDAGGWRVYGVQDPPRGSSWRQDMPRKGREFSPLQGKLLLRALMTPSSHSDLEALFDLYPGHVVELSVLDRCLGVLPGRNTIHWEVRAGTGVYERQAWNHCWAGGSCLRGEREVVGA